MPAPIPELSAHSIAELRKHVTGRVISPTDADYDEVRVVPNAAFDARPAVIVRPADASEVSYVVGLARESGLPLAVRSGGHSGAGHSVVDGSVVIDLRDMCALDIDVDAGMAWAETGLTARAYSAALAAHGQATGFGDTGSVGIGGITLGGGIGYLVRKYGLTIDDLLAVELVTADGSLLLADADHHPELFWALRGGGGNFGVATRFKLRTHAVDQIVGGMLILPATPDVIVGFVAAADAAPDEVSTIVNVMNCPPLPFVPAEYHGKVIVMALLAYVGDPATGEAVLAPFRGLATPIADMVRPMPYPALYPPEDPSLRPKAVTRTLFLDHVDHEVATTILTTLEASDAPMRVAQLRVLGGAMARVPADATAFAHRGKKIMGNVTVLFNDTTDEERRTAWATDFAAALQQGDDSAYANFLGDEGEARVRAAYPTPTWERLVAVKAQYDPENLFRLNQNVPPARP
jgi:FAD/FMN-containing dehydrogenase